MKKSDDQKPTVEVKHRSYQPKRSEQRQNVKINASPETVAASVLRQVRVVEN